MGGSKIEPLVPKKEWSYQQVKKLIDKGFPVKQIVLRVDPIVPTEKGIETAIDVINLFMDLGIKRVRISFLDMYKHVKERFNNEKVKLPYNTFHATDVSRLNALQMIINVTVRNNIDLEICGEPNIGDMYLKTTPCLSQKDVDILGLTDKITLIGNKEARTHCGCSENKTELIKDKPHQCNNKCLYCFWR